jgi:iron complex outermembrane receptor protein
MSTPTLRWLTRAAGALLLCALPAATLPAQSLNEIQLLDQSDHSPIAGAHFEYAGQAGVSDEEGVITFRYQEGAILVLSHLRYGGWRLTDQEVKTAITTGRLYAETTIFSVQPVTVIALRSQADEQETLDLDFEDYLEHDGGAILNSTPVINSIRKSGSYGFDPVLRGFKYDQLNIVLNGAHSATAACPNRMDPPTSQMAPNMIDRIEVLKGPYALRYGGAFGGTINFVQAKPRFSESLTPYGRVSGRTVGNGNVFRGEGLLGLSDQQYDIGLFASWSQGDDYKTGDGNTVKAGFKRGSFGANMGLSIADNHELTLSATRNVARDVDFAALPMDLIEDDTWLLNAQHEATFEGSLRSWNTVVFGSLVDHLMNNHLKPLEPRMVNAEMDAETRTYGARSEGSWIFGRNSVFTGLDFRAENADGSRIREFVAGANAGKIFVDNAWQNGSILRPGLFAEYQVQQDRTRYVLAARAELNLSDIADPDSKFLAIYPEINATQFNPSVSLGMINDVHGNASVGIWLGRAQRSGGLAERFINYFPVGLDPYEMLGNPQLDPEVNNQIDFNLRYQTRRTSINIDVFASYLEDAVSAVIDTTLTPRLPTSPGVRRYVNIGQAFKTGFEVSWSQALPTGLRHEFGVAYTYGQDLELDEPLPEIAPLDVRYTVVGSYLKDRLRPEVTVRHAAEQARVSTEFGESETPSFTVVDVAVSFTFQGRYRLSASAQNLLDKTYYEHLNRSVQGNQPFPVFAAGRSVNLSLGLDF